MLLVITSASVAAGTLLNSSNPIRVVIPCPVKEGSEGKNWIATGLGALLEEKNAIKSCSV